SCGRETHAECGTASTGSALSARRGPASASSTTTDSAPTSGDRVDYPHRRGGARDIPSPARRGVRLGQDRGAALPPTHALGVDGVPEGEVRLSVEGFLMADNATS